MSSIIEGYNYDIFISYRQKDNQPAPGYGWQSKGERWVLPVKSGRNSGNLIREEVNLKFTRN